MEGLAEGTGGDNTPGGIVRLTLSAAARFARNAFAIRFQDTRFVDALSLGRVTGPWGGEREGVGVVSRNRALQCTFTLLCVDLDDLRGH
jgi:hypothetical protein